MKLTGNTFLHFFSQLSAFICPGLDTRDKRPELDLHEAEAAVLIEIVMSCVVIVCPRALSREALILLVGVEAGSPSHRMRLRSRVRAHRVNGGKGRWPGQVPACRASPSSVNWPSAAVECRDLFAWSRLMGPRWTVTAETVLPVFRKGHCPYVGLKEASKHEACCGPGGNVLRWLASWQACHKPVVKSNDGPFLSEMW